MGIMRLRETHETQGDYCGLMRLMRLVQTHRNSLDSGRLMETHETLGDYWGLMVLIETSVDS